MDEMKDARKLRRAVAYVRTFGDEPEKTLRLLGQVIGLGYVADLEGYDLLGWYQETDEDDPDQPVWDWLVDMAVAGKLEVEVVLVFGFNYLGMYVQELEELMDWLQSHGVELAFAEELAKYAPPESLDEFFRRLVAAG